MTERRPVALLSQLKEIWATLDNGGGGSGGPHVHPISDVTGLQTALDGKQASGAYALTADLVWDNIGGKPSTFAPSAHSHVIADITGLQSELDGKQPTGSYSLASHNHDGIYSLAGHDHAGVYQPAGSYAASSHGHSISDVTGLQTELDGKQASGSYSLTSHDHSGVYEPAIAAGTTAQYWRGDKTWQTLPGGSGAGQIVVQFHSDGSANCTLTNQANAEQYLANSARNECQLDATNFTQVRICSQLVTASAAANSPRLYPQYHNGSAWTTIGSGTVASGEAISLATPTGNKVTSWVNLPAGAKADVRFRIAQNGGDGAADPALGNTSLQFK